MPHKGSYSYSDGGSKKKKKANSDESMADKAMKGLTKAGMFKKKKAKKKKKKK